LSAFCQDTDSLKRFYGLKDWDDSRFRERIGGFVLLFISAGDPENRLVQVYLGQIEQKVKRGINTAISIMTAGIDLSIAKRL